MPDNQEDSFFSMLGLFLLGRKVLGCSCNGPELVITTAEITVDQPAIAIDGNRLISGKTETLTVDQSRKYIITNFDKCRIAGAETNNFSFNFSSVIINRVIESISLEQDSSIVIKIAAEEYKVVAGSEFQTHCLWEAEEIRLIGYENCQIEQINLNLQDIIDDLT